jgi:hypothetical protein
MRSEIIRQALDQELWPDPSGNELTRVQFGLKE